MAPTTVPLLEEPVSLWTSERIKDLVQRRFNKNPCWYQIEAARAVYSHKDVIGCAQTGAGKTLSFWIPLLMAEEDGHSKMLFVISPLNVLAKDQAKVLKKAGISAIAVSSENATPTTFKNIESGKYHVVITNPEILVTNEKLKKLWKMPSFSRRPLAFIFDEAHCITQWGKFRKCYLAVGIIRYIISEPVPFYLASATLPPPLLAETRKLLHMNPANTVDLLCSNERPDIGLMVCQMAHPVSSYRDLEFLVPYNWQDGMQKPRKFIVFFDNIKETEAAKGFFGGRLLREHHNKLAYFHSTMSQQYRDKTLEDFRKGEIWGLCCTDAFGLGMDVGNIEIVVQYKATCDFCALWQRFGRAARCDGVQGIGILLVEKKDMTAGRKGKEISLGSKRHNKNTEGRRPKRPRHTYEAAESTKVEDEEVPDFSTSFNTAETWTCERRNRYSRPEIAPKDPTNAKKGKAPGVVPGTAMDDYINLPPFISCRRLVPQLYFANDMRTTDGHLRCDPAARGGCQRCRPRTSTICCDKCNPHYFVDFFVSPTKRPSVPRRSTLNLTYVRGPQHQVFREALFNWRELQALHELGEDVVYNLGPELFMSEDTMSRIVDCWTFHKITDIPDLRRQTDWADEWIDTCGQSLVDLLLKYSPLEEKSTVIDAPDLRVTAPEPSELTFPFDKPPT